MLKCVTEYLAWNMALDISVTNVTGYIMNYQGSIPTRGRYFIFFTTPSYSPTVCVLRAVFHKQHDRNVQLTTDLQLVPGGRMIAVLSLYGPWTAA